MTTDAVQTRQYCLQCDYPLSCLSANVCPECGRPFDPNDRNTFNAWGPISKSERWLLRPDGILLQVWAWMAPATALWAAHLPGFDWGGWILADFLLIGFASVRGIRRWMRKSIAHRYGLDEQIFFSKQNYANWAARALVLIIILACFEIPFRVCFWISEPSLLREIHALQATKVQATVAHRWTGLYYWDEVEVSNWGVRFTAGSSVLLYHPYHPPYDGAVRNLRPIGKDWYVGIMF